MKAARKVSVLHCLLIVCAAACSSREGGEEARDVPESPRCRGVGPGRRRTRAGSRRDEHWQRVRRRVRPELQVLAPPVNTGFRVNYGSPQITR